MDYQHERHRVDLVVYHLIFCPKRRRRVLIGPAQKRLEQIIHEVISEKGWHLVELAIQPDHVHVFVRTSSTTLPSDIPRLNQRMLFAFAPPGICPSAETAHSVDAFLISLDSGQCEQ